MFGTGPGSAASPERRAAYEAAFRRANANMDPGASFVAQSYDAAYVIALAIEAGRSADRAAIRQNLRTVANGPGEVVGPGEFARAKQLLGAGTKVNYEGASGPVEFNATGDAQGRVEHWAVRQGRVTSVAQLAE
jgi:branched-chain amino acid transport system substrate-binding protein